MCVARKDMMDGEWQTHEHVGVFPMAAPHGDLILYGKNNIRWQHIMGLIRGEHDKDCFNLE